MKRTGTFNETFPLIALWGYEKEDTNLMQITGLGIIKYEESQCGKPIQLDEQQNSTANEEVTKIQQEEDQISDSAQTSPIVETQPVQTNSTVVAEPQINN